MAKATEVFIFKVAQGNEPLAIEVLKGLQEEIIEAGRGSVSSVRTFVGDNDDGTVSQVYEWASVEESKRVFGLFFTFKNAPRLQALNENNVFMGRFVEANGLSWKA